MARSGARRREGEGIPAIVVGSRDLNTRFTPRLNVASDGDETARLLVDGGASAYFFERPEENRVYRIPGGASDTIPSFGTGTLGYRSPLSDPTVAPTSRTRCSATAASCWPRSMLGRARSGDQPRSGAASA